MDVLRSFCTDDDIVMNVYTDDRAREDILKIHSRKMNLMRGINMRKIAEAIPGASGAEVKVGEGEISSSRK